MHGVRGRGRVVFYAPGPEAGPEPELGPCFMHRGRIRTRGRVLCTWAGYEVGAVFYAPGPETGPGPELGPRFMHRGRGPGRDRSWGRVLGRAGAGAVFYALGPGPEPGPCFMHPGRGRGRGRVLSTHGIYVS